MLFTSGVRFDSRTRTTAHCSAAEEESEEMSISLKKEVIYVTNARFKESKARRDAGD